MYTCVPQVAMQCPKETQAPLALVSVFNEGTVSGNKPTEIQEGHNSQNQFVLGDLGWHSGCSFINMGDGENQREKTHVPFEVKAGIT